MKKLISKDEVKKFKKDGAVFLSKKFVIYWIEKLKKGIKRDIKNPSPRFKSHTTKLNSPSYLEDYWTWDLVPLSKVGIPKIHSKKRPDPEFCSFSKVGIPKIRSDKDWTRSLVYINCLHR